MSVSSECSSRKAAIAAARAADSKKAIDIMVQQVGALIGVTDYFVIATGRNKAQMDAIIDAVEEELRETCDMRPAHREVSSDGTWSLLDYGDIVVHVFLPETREYYRLEALWNDAPIVDLASEADLVGLEYSDRIRDLIEQGARIAQSVQS
ncbi:ribosome silencing factor [Adlercreutzia murintestinalis]|jgi:iojap-like ribosome-associated protein|uniref:ribosome silencing factor n=1 Tax=Adlercreutzia murintestinalis TaxID=2941325 RepID=UPI00203D32E0|nr:ribosome silencing factor [Adlercreutzia murintestinalis]